MQGNDSFRLIVRRGPQPNQTYDLNKDIITIGRDITNDIVINDPEVSRHHLRFTRGPGGFTIEDLGSTNGTFINGQRITGQKSLNNGDMIGLGETVTLGYEMVRGTSAGAPEDGGGFQPTMQSPAPQAPKPQPQAQPVYTAPPSYAPAAPAESAAPVAPSAAPYSSVGSNYESTPPPQAPSGYYEEEYEEPRKNNTMRLVLIGCSGLLVLCCCVSLGAAYYIDSQCLWWDVPVLGQVLDALGSQPTHPACFQ